MYTIGIKRFISHKRAQHTYTHITTPEVLNLAIAKVSAGHDIELPNNATGNVSRLQLRLACVDLLEAYVYVHDVRIRMDV
jgi:hypothetical protein